MEAIYWIPCFVVVCRRGAQARADNYFFRFWLRLSST